MFKKSKKGYYFWEEFADMDGIVHGFSTRKFGDMSKINPRSISNLNLFYKDVKIDENKTVKMKQNHGNTVSLVSVKDWRKTIAETDGLVSENSNVFLVATFADCIPIIFLDKKKKTVGIAHAGWKGAYSEIAKVMILKMTKIGSNTKDIIIGIGPSIRSCCYDIDKERLNRFLQKFVKWKNKIIKKRSNKIFLDLQTLIKLQLLELGVLDKNICDSGICTSDNLSDFFSFRKENKNGRFETFVGIIGRI